MAMYSKILVAVDFHTDNDAIIGKAQQLAKANGAELYAIHVNEPLAIAYGANGLGWSDQIAVLEASIQKESRDRMAALGKQLDLDASHCLIREGKPSSEVHAAVGELGIDLVVMGTHGQAGLQLLLGSTANSVLHGAACDVLCVRVGK